MKNTIEIGDKIDIMTTIPVPEGKRKKIFFSQVIDIIDESKIKISMPTESGHLSPLPIGETFSVIFYAKKGLFEAEFEVVGREIENNIRIQVMKMKTLLKKIQRRNYFRFECTLPMKFHVMEDGEKISKEKQNSLNWENGVILDLSGGGIRFVTNVELVVEDNLQIRIVLPLNNKYKELNLNGKLINWRKASNGKKVNEGRLEFVKVSEPDREYIIKYIFEEERKKRNPEK